VPDGKRRIVRAADDPPSRGRLRVKGLLVGRTGVEAEVERPQFFIQAWVFSNISLV